jgi:hypothetical protein
MSQYRMRLTREIELCLQYIPAGLRDIVLELRSLIVSVAPTAKEVVHRKGFTYYDEHRGGPVSAGTGTHDQIMPQGLDRCLTACFTSGPVSVAFAIHVIARRGCQVQAVLSQGSGHPPPNEIRYPWYLTHRPQQRTAIPFCVKK